MDIGRGPTPNLYLSSYKRVSTGGMCIPGIREITHTHTHTRIAMLAGGVVVRQLQPVADKKRRRGAYLNRFVSADSHPIPGRSVHKSAMPIYAWQHVPRTDVGHMAGRG